MLRWLGNALSSSIGKKAVMSVTGLLLVGFLVAHVSGNLTLLADEDGAAFNAYAQKLHDLGPLLWVARIGLAALFIAHIYLAFRVTLENREARKQRYEIRASHGKKTASSATMFVSGALVLGYLLKHLSDFSLDERFEADGAGLVRQTLSQPGTALIYAVGLAALLFHLLHAFQSALQTLGINHPKWSPILRIGGLGLVSLVVLLFFVILATTFAGGAA